MYKMKGIIMNTEIVKATLDGRKTAMRRVVKLDLGLADIDEKDKNYFYVADKNGDYHHILEYSPYKVGDIIYVRETFAIGNISCD